MIAGHDARLHPQVVARLHEIWKVTVQRVAFRRLRVHTDREPFYGSVADAVEGRMTFGKRFDEPRFDGLEWWILTGRNSGRLVVVQAQ